MKKRKPTDSTLRNTRAANKRLLKLEAIVKKLLSKVRYLESMISDLC